MAIGTMYQYVSIQSAWSGDWFTLAACVPMTERGKHGSYEYGVESRKTAGGGGSRKVSVAGFLAVAGLALAALIALPTPARAVTVGAFELTKTDGSGDPTEGTDYTYREGFTSEYNKPTTDVDNVLTIKTTDAVTVSMADGVKKTSTDRIVVDPGESGIANLTLDSVYIQLPDTRNNNLQNSERYAALRVDSGSLDLVVRGTNYLMSRYYAAGLENGEHPLSISGEGSLNVFAAGLAAGIGGGCAENGSNISIKGGTINAFGNYAAGIGGGNNAPGSNIQISGGKVIATGSGGGAGIGGGSGANMEADDSADGTDIEISGGVVTANGGGGHGGAGIGGGYLGSGERITISGGTVTARGGDSGSSDSLYCGAGIGAGGNDRLNDDGSSDYQLKAADIEISGGTVEATGGRSAAGIGGGGYWGTTDNSVMDNYVVSNIEISGGKVIAWTSMRDTDNPAEGVSLPQPIGAGIGYSVQDGAVSITGGVFGDKSADAVEKQLVYGIAPKDGYLVCANPGNDRQNYPVAIAKKAEVTTKSDAGYTYGETPDITNVVSQVTCGDTTYSTADELKGLSWTVEYKKGSDWVTGWPTDAGSYQVRVTLAPTIVDGVLYASQPQAVSITVKKADPVLNLVVTDDENTEKTAFTYGDFIYVKVTPGPKTEGEDSEAQTRGFGGGGATPGKGSETQLYLGDTLLARQVHFGKSSKISYRTTDKKLPIGDNQQLTVKFTGDKKFNAGETNLTLSLAKKPVTAELENPITKVYDGKAEIAGTLDFNVAVDDRAVSTDNVSATATGAFEDANAGENKKVVLSDFQAAGRDAGWYEVSAPKNVTGTITKADSSVPLQVGRMDGNEFTETSAFTYGDSIIVKFTPQIKSTTFAASPAVDHAALYLGDKQLAEAKVSEDGSFTLTYDTASKGIPVGDANELTVRYGGSGNLNAGEAKTTVKLAAKSVNAEVKGAITKVYDGTATTTVDLKVPALEGDEVAATATATFEDENVGEGKAVTLSDLQTSGSDAGWYEVALPTGALSGTITKADSDVQLTVGKMDGENFVQTADFTYGESVVVKFEPQIKKPSTLAAAPAVDHAELYYDETKLAEAAKSDDGSFTLTYDTKGKALKLGENELTVRYGGSDNLNAGTATTKVTLSRKAVTAEAKDPITKVYDGANTTAVNLTVPTLGEDEVSATAIATFDNADAGEGKAVTLSDLKTSGADADWYDVALPSGALTGSITKAESDVPLTVGKMDGEGFVQTSDFTYGESVVVRFTPQIKSTTFAASPAVDHAALYLGDEQLSEAKVSDDGSFTLTYDTKGKALKLGSNELVVKYGGSGNLNAGEAKTTVKLAAKSVTAEVRGDITKVYDGTATTTVNLKVPSLEGDEVSATSTAEFADANAGEGKAVTLKDLKVSGADAGWYDVKLPVGVTGTITKATQPAPAAPELAHRTTSSITLKAIAASETSGAAAEYSIDNGATWQDSAEFRRLKSGTRYSFVARYKGTDNFEPSPASEAASFSTNRPAPAPDPDPNPGEPTYPVETPSTEGGSATVDPSTAKPGDTVTISPKPDKGNVVSSITVKDGSGDLVPVTRNADGMFSFVMPDGKVTVSVTFVPKALAFTDVDPTAWYARGVHFVSTRGLMTGYEGQRIFGVGDTLTRGQLAVILWRRSGEVPEGFDYHASKNETGIADLADGQYYTAAANWAVKSGVIMGYENPDGSRTFGADDPVTFEQLVTILARLCAKPGEVESADTSVLDRYVDAADVSAWARQAMAWGTESGLYSGYDEGDTHRAAPLENVLRERVATVLMNAYDGGFLK